MDIERSWTAPYCETCDVTLTHHSVTDTSGKTHFAQWVCCKCGARYPVKDAMTTYLQQTSTAVSSPCFEGADDDIVPLFDAPPGLVKQ